MKHAWLDKETAFKSAPGLKEHIPEWERVSRIGVSNSGNIKYILDGQTLILSQQELGRRPMFVFPALFDEITRTEAAPASDTTGAIVLSYDTMNSILPDIAKLGGNADFIIQNGELYQRRKNKKTKRHTITGKFGSVGPILAKFFEAYSPDNTDYIKGVIRQHKSSIERTFERVLKRTPQDILANFEYRIRFHECFAVLYGRRTGEVDWGHPAKIDYLTTKDEEQEQRLSEGIRAYAKTRANEQTKKNLEKAEKEAVLWFKECVENICRKLIPNTKRTIWVPQNEKQKGRFPAISKNACIIELDDNSHLTIPPISFPERYRTIYFHQTPGEQYSGDPVSFRPEDASHTKEYLEKTLKEIEHFSIQTFGTELQKVLSYVFEDFQKDVEIYNNWADPALSGKKPITASVAAINDSALILKKGKICFEFHTKLSDYIVTHEGALRKTLQDSFKQVKAETEKVRYSQAVAFYKDELASKNIAVKYKSGSGLLYGETDIEVSAYGFKEKITFDGPGYHEGLTAWKKSIHQLLTDTADRLQHEKEERDKAFIARNSETIGSFLSRDILSFVTMNQNYITANASVEYFRGLKIKFNGDITNVGTYGKYSLIKSEDIKSEISRLLRSGALTYKTLDGTYGSFNILKPTLATPALIAYQMDVDGVALLKKLRKEAESGAFSGKPLNDFEAEAVFTQLDNLEEPSVQDCMILLHIVRNPGFMCAYFDKLVAFCKSKAPKEFIEYLKMLKSVEENALLCKFVREAVKKDKTAANGSVSDIGEVHDEKPAIKQCKPNEESDIKIIAIQKEFEEDYGSFTHKYTEERYVVASTSTGEVLDDAQGYGYKSKQGAMRAWNWKNR